MKKYEFLEHTADVKFQAFGKNLEETFSNCAYALTRLLTEQKIKPKKTKSFIVKGKDLENLLYNFLEEFLFLFDSKKIILSKIKSLKINEKKLELKCEFYLDLAKNYKINTSIKAITYNEMFIKKQRNNFVAQVVLDV